MRNRMNDRKDKATGQESKGLRNVRCGFIKNQSAPTSSNRQDMHIFRACLQKEYSSILVTNAQRVNITNSANNINKCTPLNSNTSGELSAFRITSIGPTCVNEVSNTTNTTSSAMHRERSAGSNTQCIGNSSILHGLAAKAMAGI